MISHFIQLVIDFIGNHPGLAIFIVFAISMGEALFIIGLFVPSTVVLVSAGTLIGLGQLSFVPIYLSATLGAVVGDAISYWIGHLGKDWIRDVWPFNRYVTLLVRGEAFFDRHGTKSIFIGRFIPGVKAVVPGIAGMMGMSAMRFSIINVVSALVWTAAHILPGIGLGRGLDVAGAANPRLIAVLAAFLFLAVAAWYLTRLVLGFVLPHLERMRAAAIIWLNGRPAPATRLAIRVLANEEGILVPLFWALFALAATSGLIALTVNALFDPALATSDNAVSGFIQSFRTAPADEAMIVVTMLGDRVVLATLAAVFVLWLAVVRSFRLAAASLIAFGASAAFAPTVRSLLDRAQETAFFNGADTSSFPSSHATMAAVVLGVIALTLAHNMSARWRTVLYASTAAIVAMIGFSRVYLLVHWPSEVSSGLLFGGAVVSVVAFLIHGRAMRIGAHWLAGVLVVAFLAVFPAHVLSGLNRAVGAYAPVTETVTMSAGRWLSHGWHALPSARILLDGQNGEPFVLQTDLKLATIEERLSKAGWRKVVPRRLEALLMSAIPLPLTLSERPVLPFYHNGMRPDAEFTGAYCRQAEPPVLGKKAAKPTHGTGLRVDRRASCSSAAGSLNSRIVLRIWKSAVRIKSPGEDRPVLLVSLARETLEPFVFDLSDLAYRPLDAFERENATNRVLVALNPDGALSPTSPRAGLTLLPSP